MRTALLWALAGLGLGVAGGLMARGGKPPLQGEGPGVREGLALQAQVEALSDQVKRLEQAASTAEASAVEKAGLLERRQAELEMLKAQLAQAAKEAQAGMKGTQAALTAEEARTRNAALKASFEEAFARKDGKAVIDALHALMALGPEAYPLAAELWLRVHRDFDGGGNTLGLSYPLYYESMGDPGFMRWALENPGLDPAIRLHAVWGLPWTDPHGAAAYLASAAERQQDPDVLGAVAMQLASLADPATLPGVLAMAQRAGLDAKARRQFVQALGSFPGAEVERALAALAADADAGVRDAAKVALVMQHPPAAGIVLTQVASGSQAEALGLQRGDIVLSYNQRPLTSMDMLGGMVHGSDPAATATLQVYRNGGIETLVLKGGRIGIDGRYVKPR